MFAVPEIPWISRRLVQTKTIPSRHHPSHQVCQLFKQEPTKQNSSTQLRRHNRIGNLPDISISHETILNPLQEIIKRDPLTCKNLTVRTVSSLIKKVEDLRNQKKNENPAQPSLKKFANNSGIFSRTAKVVVYLSQRSWKSCSKIQNYIVSQQ